MIWLLALLLAPAGARELELPEGARQYASPVDGTPSADPWWAKMSDPSLRSLLDNAMSENLDISAARERAHMARAVAWQTRSVMVPSVSFDAGVTNNPTDSLGFGFGIPSNPNAPPQPDTYQNGNALLNARWQVDIWGRNALQWNAAHLDALASEGDRDGVALQMTTLLAEAYYDVVAAEQRLQVVEAQIEMNEGLLEVLELGYQKGAGDGLAVLQQRQQLASTRTLLPQLRTLAALRRQQLAVLSGQPPMTPLNTVDTLPELPPQPATGEPLDLVDNRPDLVAAAKRFGSARSRKNAAYRDLLPTLAASGNTGWQGIRFDEWETQTTWQMGAQASVPLFEGGRRHSAVKQASAAEDAAYNQLVASVFLAIQEVEGGMVTERERTHALEAVEAQEKAAREAFEEAKRRYLAGATEYTTVMQSLGAMQGAQLNLIQSRRDLLSARIQLHDALGGPWTRNLASVSK